MRKLIKEINFIKSIFSLDNKESRDIKESHKLALKDTNQNFTDLIAIRI